MFDQYLQPVPVGPRRRTATVVGVSVFAHTGALAAILLIGMWRIDKLQVEDRPPVAFAAFQPPDRPMPGGGDGKLPPLKKKSRGDDGVTQAKQKSVTDLQPTDEPPVEEDVKAGAHDGADDGTDDGSPWGHEAGDENGTGTGIYTGDGRCPMPVCGLDTSIPKVEVPDDPPAQEDEIVAPDVLNGYRVSGKEKIAPSDPVRVAMVQAGQDTLTAAIRICVDRNGKVRDLRTLKSSGYDEYDRDLLRAMRGWRYRPYTIDGKAVPACTAIHFRFHMQ